MCSPSQRQPSPFAPPRPRRALGAWVLAAILAACGLGRGLPGSSVRSALAAPLAGAALPGAATVGAVPVATTAPGWPATGTGVTVPATAALPGDGTDLGMLLLLMSAIFACIGLFRGSRREIPALFGTVLAYLVIGRAWHLIDRVLNLLWRLFNFGVLRRGVMADNPGQAWNEASGLAPLVPAEGSGLRMAQMLAFAVALVAIYAATRRQAEPGFVERLIGAVVASVTGYLVGVFMLSRILPQAQINLLAPGEVALHWIQMLGPMAGLVLVAAVIIFGWRALGPKGFTKRYG